MTKLNWMQSKLCNDSLVEIIMGQSPPSSTYNKEGTGIPFFQGKAEFGKIYPSFNLFCSDPIKIADENDILISVRAPVGDVNIAPLKCCIGRCLSAIRPNKSYLNFWYLYYILKISKRTFESLSTGSTFKAIKKADLENLKIPLPPLPEQNKIAEILTTVDEAIEKVDGAIQKAERLKKGLMQTLLTRGIGHKEFKETKIGMIPKDWELSNLSDVSSVRYGLGQPPSQNINGIPMIRATNIKKGRITKNNLIYIAPEAVPIKRKPFLKKNDIIVVRSGAYTGDIALISEEWQGAVAGYDLIVTPSKKINPKFIAFFLLSSYVQKKYFFGLKVRSAQPHLNTSQVEKTPIPLPPLPEQKKIADILSTADQKLELMRESKSKLNRVKKGLMNDLLSGKRRIKL